MILERGGVGERWRTARWDSFRLLTPNWLSRLPGWAYTGPDPDGFMTRAEIIAYLEGYARRWELPVREGIEVKTLERRPDPPTCLPRRGIQTRS